MRFFYGIVDGREFQAELTAIETKKPGRYQAIVGLLPRDGSTQGVKLALLPVSSFSQVEAIEHGRTCLNLLGFKEQLECLR